MLLQTTKYPWFAKSIRHLAEWRLLFLRSYTMIVMVYFPIWNVIRISFTSFRRCRSNRLRVCCSPFYPCGYLYCNAISGYCQSVAIFTPRPTHELQMWLECVSKMRDVQFRVYWAAYQGDFPQACWVRAPGKQSSGLFSARTGRQTPEASQGKSTQKCRHGGKPEGFAGQRLR